MAERLLELKLENGRIGICGLGFGTRTPEGSIFHGTFTALRDALPNAELVSASGPPSRGPAGQEPGGDRRPSALRRFDRAGARSSVRVGAAWRAGLRRLGRDHARDVGPRLRAVGPFQLDQRPQPRPHPHPPDARPLAKGDLIIKEIESSIIGYRAQQLRPTAVHECDPTILELSKAHAELYDKILGFLNPALPWASSSRRPTRSARASRRRAARSRADRGDDNARPRPRR